MKRIKIISIILISIWFVISCTTTSKASKPETVSEHTDQTENSDPVNENMSSPVEKESSDMPDNQDAKNDELGVSKHTNSVPKTPYNPDTKKLSNPVVSKNLPKQDRTAPQILLHSVQPSRGKATVTEEVVIHVDSGDIEKGSGSSGNKSGMQKDDAQAVQSGIEHTIFPDEVQTSELATVAEEHGNTVTSVMKTPATGSQDGNSQASSSQKGNSQDGSSQKDNSQTDNSQTDNSQTDNSQTDNSQTSSSQDGSSQKDNSQTDNSQTSSSQKGSSQDGSSQTDSSQKDNSQTDNSQTSSSQKGNSQDGNSEQVLTDNSDGNSNAETNSTDEVNDTIQYDSIPPASRTVQILQGQQLDVLYPGESWVYIGEKTGQSGMKYLQRRLKDHNAIYTFLAVTPGDYILAFSQFDVFTNQFLTDALLVTVVPSDQKRTERVRAPDYKQEKNVQVSNKESVSTSTNQEKSTNDYVPDVSQNSSDVLQNGEAQDVAVAVDEPSVQTLSAPLATEPQTAYTASDLLAQARQAIAEGNAEKALGVLEQFFLSSTNQLDEGWFLRGQAYELNTPKKDIRKALSAYRTVTTAYPHSKFWEAAKKRIRYIERFYVNIE